MAVVVEQLLTTTLAGGFAHKLKTDSAAWEPLTKVQLFYKARKS